VKLSEVTDGTSNTIALGEHAHALLSKTDAPGTPCGGSFYRYQTWCAGTPPIGALLTEHYPINAYKKYPASIGSGLDGQGGAIIQGASSFHPGGANFAFCDGSVKFLKDTIDSWGLQTNSNPAGLPIGASYNSLAGYSFPSGTKIGVY